ncbi:TadE/TadG family type IV pilus assembly protein [Acidicapsa dinghuensis]|uniref:TadE/TadG family type IV pilus assembly protein n=1 Tax=Acidicapsa dinghuensis TaxID=2218256 RepID=A0ABW1E941_9BACT|nr:TadE/TadG family type IV pilus assembly protein [Acidicapsa dinghuensis]
MAGIIPGNFQRGLLTQTRQRFVFKQHFGFLRREEGSQMVEFALSISVLFAVLCGIFGFCEAIYSSHFVAYAAESGARYAMVRGAEWKTSCNTSAPPNFTLGYNCQAVASDVQNYVRSIALPGINQSAVTVSTTWPGTTPDCTTGCTVCTTTTSQGCFVTVQVTYPFQFRLPFLSRSTMSLTSTSEKVIQ